jgi:hypothetical protein
MRMPFRSARTAPSPRVWPRGTACRTDVRSYAQHHRRPIGRFPMLAYLACCEDIYVDDNGQLIGSYQGVDAVLSTGDG